MRSRRPRNWRSIWWLVPVVLAVLASSRPVPDAGSDPDDRVRGEVGSGVEGLPEARAEGAVPVLELDAPIPAPADRTTGEAEPRELNRIVGGYVAPPYPFAAAILRHQEDRSWKVRCTGSLIAPSWVLTAAHCRVTDRDIVLVGRADLRKATGQLRRVARVEPHPKYPRSSGRDVALLELQRPTEGLAVLALADERPVPHTPVSAIGWGLTSYRGESSDVLLQVDIETTDNESCRAAYEAIGYDGAFLTAEMLCAGEPGKSACQGDSGGPLFTGDGSARLQVGVVSSGHKCGETYGVYTSTAAHLGWIRCVLDGGTKCS